jgi:hypothetical protein
MGTELGSTYILRKPDNLMNPNKAEFLGVIPV